MHRARRDVRSRAYGEGLRPDGRQAVLPKIYRGSFATHGADVQHEEESLASAAILKA